MSGSAQYLFTKIIQFSPRGEGVIDNSNYTLAPVSEIGVQASHGTALAVTVDPVTGKYLGNLVAVQLTGVGGNVKIYRR